MILICVILPIILGVILALTLYVHMQNDRIILENKRLQKELLVLQVKNRELSKLPINNYKYKKLRENLLIIKERSLRGDITGKQFCKEVATIIKLYC